MSASDGWSELAKQIKEVSNKTKLDIKDAHVISEWTFNLRNTIMEEKGGRAVYKILKGETPRPSFDEKAIEKWDEDNDKAITTLRSRIKAGLHRFVNDDSKTAAEMFKAVCLQVLKTAGDLTDLWDQFMVFRQKDPNTGNVLEVNNYVTIKVAKFALYNFAAQFYQENSKGDTELIKFLSRGLYGSIFDNIRLKYDNPLSTDTLSDFEEELTKLDNLRKEREKEEKKSSSKSFGNKKYTHDGNQDTRNDRSRRDDSTRNTNYRNNRRDDDRNDRHRSNYRRDRRDNRHVDYDEGEITCHHCGEEGHIVKGCFKTCRDPECERPRCVRARPSRTSARSAKSSGRNSRRNAQSPQSKSRKKKSSPSPSSSEDDTESGSGSETESDHENGETSRKESGKKARFAQSKKSAVKIETADFPWGKSLASVNTKAEQETDIVSLVAIDSGSTFPSFPDKTWFVEDTIKPTEITTTAIDGRDVTCQGTGMAVFRLLNPSTGKFLLVALESILQDANPEPVIAEGVFCHLPNFDIISLPKSEDPQKAKVITYKEQPWIRLYPHKDNLYYVAIQPATEEEKIAAQRIIVSGKALYAPAPKRKITTVALIHGQRGHPLGPVLQRLVEEYKSNGYKVEGEVDKFDCTSCNICKMKPLPSTRHDRRQRTDVLPGEKWSHDSSGKMPVPAIGFNGGRFRSIIVDYYSGLYDVKITKTRTEQRAHIQHIQRRTDALFGTKRFKICHTDNAPEMVGSEMTEYFRNEGILHATSPPYFHQGNPDAENTMKQNMIMAVTMMVHARVSKKFWGWACVGACYRHQYLAPVVDHFGSKTTPKTRYELFYGQDLPLLHHVKTLFCDVIYYIPPDIRPMFDPYGALGMYVGNDHSSQAYIIYTTGGRFLCTRHVRFYEEKFTFGRDEPIGIAPTIDEIKLFHNEIDAMFTEAADTAFLVLDKAHFDLDSDAVASEEENDSPAEEELDADEILTRIGEAIDLLTPKKLKYDDDPIPQQEQPMPTLPQQMLVQHGSQPPVLEQGQPQLTLEQRMQRVVEQAANNRAQIRMTRSQTRALAQNELSAQGAARSLLSPGTKKVSLDPKNTYEAMSGKYGDWKDVANKQEYWILEDNGQMEVVSKPPDVKMVQSRTVYETRKGKQKVRFCIRGDLMDELGITSAHVVNKTTLFMMLVDAARLGLEMIAFDVSKAFCEARRPVGEEIYTTIPKDYINRKGLSLIDKVFKVYVYLYGTRDAMYKFCELMTEFLEMQCSFTKSEKDPMMFYRFSNGVRQQIAIHVDDGLIVGSKTVIEEVKKKLSKRFKMKFDEDVDKFLGINIWRNREEKEIAVSQHDYILAMTERFGPVPATRKFNVPMHEKFDAIPTNNDEPADTKRFQELVGSLLHATMTRKDILYAVHLLARYMAQPKVKHYEAAKQILFYLNETKDYALVLGEHDSCMSINYSDASYAREEDYHSRSGGVLFYYGSLVASLSKVQRLITLSTAESEYVSCSEVATMIIYVRQYLVSIGVNISITPSVLFLDNTAAIAMAEETATYSRTKHIAIRYHVTKGYVKSGDLVIEYVHTDDQVADIMTKPLPRDKFEKFRTMMHYRPGYAPLRRSVEKLVKEVVL